MSVVIETTLGDITIDLFIQERPKTCFNFIKLCKIRFYNCCLFHRIERDFIAQTGDPSIDRKREDDRRFRGGCSIFQKIKGNDHVFFEKEVKPRIKHTKFGTISMVDNGEGMHGSQFFITLSENLDFLDGHHTVFGEVVEGTDVLLKLNSEICDTNHRPYRDVRITHTVVLEDPFEDPPELKEAVSLPSPEIWPEVFDSERIGVEEAVDETDGKPLEEIEEELQEKEAKARATILEMIGDLPDADMAPPENVLFVCKLNPVTREEDLEIIFSRFGHIKSCEVIKDAKTGESLQYAFIEFENREDCEKAYFKMDNVLIDDRRIHVDFSQSVSKYKWKGKGRGVIVKEDEPHQKSRDQDHKKRSHEDSTRRREDDRRKHRRTRSRSPERSSHHHSSRRHNYRERRSRSRDRKYDRNSSRYSPPRHSSHHKDRRRRSRS